MPEPETEETEEVTYQDLHRRVNEFAALLRDFAGVEVGDRVTFHLPMVPDLPVSMLACARLGVIHSEVFGGFSGAACGHRIADSQSRILVTMDAYYRNGELIDHKVKADEAIAAAQQGGLRDRQGARLAAARGRIRLAEPDGRGPRLLHRRADAPNTAASWSSRSRCRPRRRCS